MNLTLFLLLLVALLAVDDTAALQTRDVSFKMPNQQLQFQYQYSRLELDNSIGAKNTTGVMLIHPVGVGIGKWFYERLASSLSNGFKESDTQGSFIFLVPDLLGSGSACNPLDDAGQTVEAIPLLNISDWTSQVSQLMAAVEDDEPTISNWCVVANGGCSPIALQIAQRSVKDTAPFRLPVRNVILSSLPRPAFFLNATDPAKVKRSYQTLIGPVGKIFWWYSCRNEGSFIQKFSERNLVADSANLGDEWTPNCVVTARMHDGKSRYSTFSFLAGTLQDGCVDALNDIEANKDRIAIHTIRGRDVRRNRARSWFWQKPKKKEERSESDAGEDTFRAYLEQRGIGGKEKVVGGRISLAHEDSDGYANALMEYLSE